MLEGPHFERLVEYVTGNYYSRELPELKLEYQKLAGTIYDDDNGYENRMGLFLEWVIFDRLLPGKSITLLEGIVEENKDSHAVNDTQDFQNFVDCIHGLFMLLKIHDEKVVVRNLFDHEKYTVHGDQAHLMFAKNDIFQARILPVDGGHYFTGNFCYHPQPAAAYIKSEVKNIVGMEERYQKELKTLVKQMKPLITGIEKTEKLISKLTAKLEKCESSKKSEALQSKREESENIKRNLEAESTQVQTQIDDCKRIKLKIGLRHLKTRLMHRLNYMNLKWERSRQIEIQDIYCN